MTTHTIDLQERRLEKARAETPAELAEQLYALIRALRPILERLERDLAAPR